VADKVDLDEKLAFLSFTEEDRLALEPLRPILERHADRLVAHFYRHLLSFEATRALLTDPELKQRVLRKQREYLISLGGTPVDEDYAADRLRIGQVHERVGLGPGWYLGAYSLHFSMIVPLIQSHYENQPHQEYRAITALVKLIMLDAQIAMEAYIGERESRLEYLNRELAAAGRALEKEVEETGAELRETTKRARIAEELASTATLVAGLAHEIGTPMNVIQGHTELLESAIADKKARERLGIIRKQVERISNIIRTLLNVSRPRQPNRMPLLLNEVLDTTLSFVQEKLRRRGIVPDRRFEEVPEIRADADKLQQLFLNLFLNAADSMPEGGTLIVSLRAADPDGVEVRIRDTGNGMPPQKVERIFDPFFTTKPAGEGHGLGLVVAKGIVLDHDGEIEVTSTPGEGTEFRIQLPSS
jgi:signal transduction histidine kinase